ncbi:MULTISPECIES: hypothetical protein [unclassified Tolypothrix]|uniref:Uncharacterized protein n=1 Tax=Microchaete diplosiphon TaxID=1197 RepID=Q6GZY9_MICDP|nr:MULTISPECIES: hypothetical protein [unclassified Tolypothrix]AAT41980.1 hypothetical protein [Fremyella diplosiphon Fd33]BAY89656.1 hypothetical protein NIES3275_16590 [Microchaete diplosiphon NIES-3275]EKE97649.1 hypothetical protein FDUTEX481_05027 [Tolypothrix sp. PCC 7601]MBE9083224.1 hypothetical protein [Tolypothrix sp. LEGE 11397]UYD23926.1 hypothetical protein HGR01_20715 [Tolypothrix sp. PCC 7712]
MAIATRTDSSLSATVTQTTLVNALKTAFTNAGYSSPISDYTSGTDRILVYQWDVDNTKVQGINYLRVRISNTLIIYQQLYTTWNTGTNTGTNSSSEVTYTTLAATNTIGFVSLNGSTEYKLVLITQGTTFIPLGLLVPANKPDWWDLNNWSYGFIFLTSTMQTLRTSNANPYSNTDFDYLTNTTRIANVNGQTNRRDIFSGLVLLSQSNQGSAGRTSDDVGQYCGNGSARYDTAPVFGTSQQYLVVVNAASGIIIRTA